VLFWGKTSTYQYDFVVIFLKKQNLPFIFDVVPIQKVFFDNYFKSYYPIIILYGLFLRSTKNLVITIYLFKIMSNCLFIFARY